VVVSAIVTVASLGCSGAASSSTTGANGTSGGQGAALTKSQFLANGNAICTMRQHELDAAVKKAFDTHSPSQAKQERFVADTLIPNIQQQIDGIKALPPPSGDDDQVAAITDAVQSALEEAKADPFLLTDEGQSGLFAQANKLARKYGLTKCKRAG